MFTETKTNFERPPLQRLTAAVIFEAKTLIYHLGIDSLNHTGQRTLSLGNTVRIDLQGMTGRGEYNYQIQLNGQRPRNQSTTIAVVLRSGSTDGNNLTLGHLRHALEESLLSNPGKIEGIVYSVF